MAAPQVPHTPIAPAIGQLRVDAYGGELRVIGQVPSGRWLCRYLELERCETMLGSGTIMELYPVVIGV